MRSVAHFKRAAVALDGLAEFGAVNCDKAHTLCSKLGIKSFPKFLLFSPRFEWSEEYPKDRLKELGKPKDAMGDDIVEWVRLMLPPFVPGHAVMLDATASSGATASSEAPPAAEASGGRAALLSWEGLWVLLCVAGHDPARCAACNDAKPNLLREPPRYRRLIGYFLPRVPAECRCGQGLRPSCPRPRLCLLPGWGSSIAQTS